MIEIVVLRKVFLALAILSIIDVVVGVSASLFHNLGPFSEKSSGKIASDLAFIEGASILFIGALISFFTGSVKLREMALIIIGVAMIGMSVAFGIFA